jgi:hypothetical protein
MKVKKHTFSTLIFEFIQLLDAENPTKFQNPLSVNVPHIAQYYSVQTNCPSHLAAGSNKNGRISNCSVTWCSIHVCSTYKFGAFNHSPDSSCCYITRKLRAPNPAVVRNTCIGLVNSKHFHAKMPFEDLNLSSVELV